MCSCFTILLSLKENLQVIHSQFGLLEGPVVLLSRGSFMEIFIIFVIIHYLWFVWIEGKRGRVEQGKAKLVKNQSIFSHLYSTLLPSTPSPFSLNPNEPLRIKYEINFSLKYKRSRMYQILLILLKTENNKKKIFQLLFINENTVHLP